MFPVECFSYWSIHYFRASTPPISVGMTSSFPAFVNNDPPSHIHLDRRAPPRRAKRKLISSFRRTWCMGNGGAEEQTEHGGESCDLIQKRIPVLRRSPDKIELLSFLPLSAPAPTFFASFNTKSYSRKGSARVAKQVLKAGNCDG